MCGRAHLNDKLDPRVVVGQRGWWQACPDQSPRRWLLQLQPYAQPDKLRSDQRYSGTPSQPEPGNAVAGDGGLKAPKGENVAPSAARLPGGERGLVEMFMCIGPHFAARKSVLYSYFLSNGRCGPEPRSR